MSEKKSMLLPIVLIVAFVIGIGLFWLNSDIGSKGSQKASNAPKSMVEIGRASCRERVYVLV